MNKTVTINLGGWVFHIEEDAYAILKAYLESLRIHFSKMESGSEVMEDIEARIAEILKERLGNSREVVIEQDVSYVQSEIGSVEDFDEIESDENAYESDTTFNGKAKRVKRLFRDKEHAVLGGVCNGIANYFGIDVVWIRLAFILAMFSGMSFFVYIVLWMVVPEALTLQDKMEMKGEPFNLDNLEKNIKKEFRNVKKEMEGMAKSAKKVEVGSTLERVIFSLGRFFVQLLKLAFRLLGVGLIVAIFAITIAACILMFHSSLLGLFFGGS